MTAGIGDDTVGAIRGAPAPLQGLFLPRHVIITKQTIYRNCRQ